MSNDDLYSKISEISANNTAKSQEFAREEMRFNAAEAQKNRDWQAEQSATAHQREVADLQKAGLNPVLSAGGTGASTGSGSSASGASGKVDETVVPALTSIIVNQQNAANQLKMAELQRDATLQAAQLSAQTQLQAAQIAASASRASAITSANAQKYAADQSHKSAVYGSNMSYSGTALTAKTSKQNTASTNKTSKSNAKTAADAQKYTANTSLFGKIFDSVLGLFR